MLANIQFELYLSLFILHLYLLLFFFFNATATTEIYTLSLHDALPISRPGSGIKSLRDLKGKTFAFGSVSSTSGHLDRKSTRLNSSHTVISYAVFCLKKKKNRCNCVQHY